MRNRRRSIVALVAVLLLASGCQMARAGTRCRPGASPARDSTHVLFCQGGRWRKTVTIQQATDIIVARIPSRIDAETGAVLTVGQTSEIPMSFAVTSPNFRFVPGVAVDVTVDNSGGTDVSTIGTSFISGANGRIEVPVRAGTRAGDALVTARVAGIAEPARARVKIWPGTFDRVVVVSGEGQSAPAGQPFAPLVLRAVDRFGNGVLGAGLSVRVTDPRSLGFVVSSRNLESGQDGLVTVPVTAGQRASRSVNGDVAPMAVTVAWGQRELVVPFTVVAGPPFARGISMDNTSAQVGTDFVEPVIIVVLDEFGNGVPGFVSDVQAIPGPSGASGIVATPQITSEIGGIAFGVRANAVAGTWTLRITGDGFPTANIPMTNTP